MADVTTLADGTRFDWDAGGDDPTVTVSATGGWIVISQTRKFYQAIGQVNIAVPEVDASGIDLETFGAIRIVRDAGGSFLEIETSTGEKVGQ